jgi:hypothetical protein
MTLHKNLNSYPNTMTENDKQLQNIAQKIANDAGIPESQEYGSVILLLMITSIILTSIRILQECNNKSSDDNKVKSCHQQILAVCGKKSWFTKIRLKRLIRKELGCEEYKQYGDKLVDSILNTGANLTEEETKNLMEAINV